MSIILSIATPNCFVYTFYMLVAILILLTLFVFPKPAHADIPILHQLFYAYLPDTYLSINDDISVLGVSTTNPSFPDSAPIDKKTITIAVLGDSMIDTLGAKIPTLESALTKYYPGKTFKILNYGVGSQTIESGFNRLTQAYDYKDQHFPPLISNHPDIVVVESFAYNNFGNTPEGLGKHSSLLNNILSTLKKELPNSKIIIAATIAPNSTIFANKVTDLNLSQADRTERTYTIRKYLQDTIDFATSQNLPLVNAYHASLSGNDGNKSYINPVDNIHPSPAGAAFFSNILAKTIFDNRLIN